MQILDNISNEGRQKFTILLDEDNSAIVINLTYKPTQLGWFADIEYETKNFSLYNLRITTNYNLLNQWHNLLPFGLACICKDNQDPLSIQDFLVGRAQLAVLSESEVNEIIEQQKEQRSEDF